MATNGATPEFRIPQEPLPVPPIASDDKPVPFVGSDEESFVVLGKSLITDFDDLSLEEDSGNLGRSIIQEAKQLIRDELERIEIKPARMELVPEKVNEIPEQVNGVPENVNNVPVNQISHTMQNGGEPSTGLSYHTTNSGDMDHSSVLPAMPQPQLYPRVEMDGNNDSRTISIISFAPSEFASEELQGKVSQLIEENVHLKDTILQNNMSMKAQYEKIVAWQQDVEKVHEAHKEKFRHAKQYIETLKKENVRLEQQSNLLQQEIENLRYSLKLRNAEHDKTKQVLTQSSENNLKDFELDVANKKIKDLEESLEKAQNIASKQIKDLEASLAKAQYIASKQVKDLEDALEQAQYIASKQVKDLEEALEKAQKKGIEDLSNETSKWSALEEKLVKYEKELEEAYKKNRELEKSTSHNDAHNCMETLKVTEERLLLTEQANNQAAQEILSLRNHIAKNLQTSEESPKLQFELQQAKIKLAELDEMLTSRNATLIDSNMRASKMEEQLVHANERTKAMEGTVAALQLQLEETKIEVWKNKQKLNDKDTQLQMTNKELEAAKYQKHVQPSNYDELTYLRQQLMQSQITMTHFDQNRAIAHAQLEKQKNEIAELRAQLEEKHNETDAMFALRTQLDMYKVDFEAERDAKEEVKIEKNKISEDLQHLHRRNQQLQEEIEILRKLLQQNGVVPHARSETGNSSQGSSGWATGRNKPSQYRCPKCQFGFQTLRDVENHVMACIDLDESLP